MKMLNIQANINFAQILCIFYITHVGRAKNVN